MFQCPAARGSGRNAHAEGQAAGGLEAGAEGLAGFALVPGTGALRGEGAQGGHRLPLGGGPVLRFPADALRGRARAAAGPGPVPRAGTGAWAGVLGEARGALAALAG